MSWTGLSAYIWNHVRRHPAAYLCSTLCFLAGLTAGAIGVNELAPAQRAELSQYLSLFFSSLARGQTAVDPRLVFEQAAWDNLRTAGLLWLFGLTVVGAPLVLLLLFVHGFAIGFSVGFLLYRQGWPGLAFALTAVLPQNLLEVPALLGLAAVALTYSAAILASRLRPERRAAAGSLFRYTGAVLLLSACLLGASLLEAFLTPSLLGLLAAG